MELSAENLPAWLSSQGILNAADIARGDFSITSVERRNRGFRVVTSNGGVFVKQARRTLPALIDSVQREVNWYRSVSGISQNRPSQPKQSDSARSDSARSADNEQFGHLQLLLPRFLTADTQRLALALELVMNAVDLKEFHRQIPGSYPLPVARAMGTALATLHRTSQKLAPAPSVTSSPEILSITQYRLSDLVPETPVTKRLASTIVAQSDIPQRLKRLAREWQSLCVIHGDLRWENVLISNGTTSDPSLHLIDWEHTQAGDPLWDLAGAIECYLRVAMLAFEMNSLTSSQNVATLLPSPVKAAIARFWTVYWLESHLPVELQRHALIRTVEYTGCRLIQSAFENGGVSTSSAEWCLALLHAGLTALRTPEALADILRSENGAGTDRQV